MDTARLKIEQTILERSFPGRYQLRAEGMFIILEVLLRVSAGSHFRLMLRIAPDYPSSIPQAFIKEPAILKDFHGHDLVRISPSHPMHLLKPEARMVQLCHYRQENWHSNVTLYKVVLKCLIWLEAYQNHLQSGRPLTDFLGS